MFRRRVGNVIEDEPINRLISIVDNIVVGQRVGRHLQIQAPIATPLYVGELIFDS